MVRKLQILFILLAGATLALIGFNFVSSPMEAKRAWLRAELAKVPEAGGGPGLEIGTNTSFSSLVAQNASVWEPLVDRPQQVVAEKKSEMPDMDKLLEGVVVTKFKIGDRIKIISKTSPDGGFYGIGEKVEGCTLKEFTRTDATFTYHWKEGNQTLEKRMPRQ